MKRLEGKVALVTGGNSGIGLATAKRLQQEGAKVAITGRSKKTLDEAGKAIGNGVLAIQGDVAKIADLDKLYAEVSAKLGKIDVLFVNAGVAKFAPLAETSESTYDEQFDINIKGAYFTQATVAAISSGWPKRFIGTFPTISFAKPSMASLGRPVRSKIGVAIGPGKQQCSRESHAQPVLLRPCAPRNAVQPSSLNRR